MIKNAVDIRVQGISKMYSSMLVPAVQELSLDVVAGQRVGITGPSGVGKTTLLMIMAGILIPDRGSVWVGPYNLSDIGSCWSGKLRLQHFGVMSQSDDLLEHLSALDNIALGVRLSGLEKRWRSARDRASEWMRLLGLVAVSHKGVCDISGGERKRVSLARALAKEPKVLFLDEPTSELDDETAHRAIESTWDYLERSGATLIVCTHDRRVLDRVTASVVLKRPSDGRGRSQRK